MRKLALLFLLILLAGSMMAVPALREWRSCVQPDGTVVDLMLVGDENYHYYMTRDGLVVLAREDGAFVYASVSASKLQPTGRMAHDPANRIDGEVAGTITMAMAEKARPQKRRSVAGTRRRALGKPSMVIGKQKMLVVLANFSDAVFIDYTEADGGRATRDRYDAIFNKEGYTNDTYQAIGSVRDYFLDQSGGRFDLSFDVVGPVQLEKPTSYYGSNKSINDKHAPEIVVDCCQAVADSVDFSEYDNDGDGMVDQVFVLYAGYGESTGGLAETIWPHMWSLQDAVVENHLQLPELWLDGVQVNVYACSNELAGKTRQREMGIGVVCHELSHCFGLPDLYDFSEQHLYGLGFWDVLDMGCYGGYKNLGWVPVGYNSYERHFLGWLDFAVLSTDTTVVGQRALGEGGEAFIVPNDAYPDEFYILENRSQSGWDASLPGAGLLVAHVDYDSLLWATNNVNSVGAMNDHPRYQLFHACDSVEEGGEAYPSQNNDSLTDFSSPAAELYHENIDGERLMHKSITHITRDEDDGEVSFEFRNLNLLSAIRSAPPHSASSFTSLPGSSTYIYYNLQGMPISSSHPPRGIHIVRKPDGKYIKSIEN